MRLAALLVVTSWGLATAGGILSCQSWDMRGPSPAEDRFAEGAETGSAGLAAPADVGPFSKDMTSGGVALRPGPVTGGFGRVSPSGARREEEAPTSETPAATASARKIVYRGFLRLEVKRVRKAADAIQRMTEKAGGYVQSLSRRAIVVRVPGTDFETAMDLFQSAGRVLDRKVQAYDVTARFTDLRARLEVAEGAKKRLLQLLESEKDPKERLRIISEVKRLTETVESIRATLETLKNLVDYYTITIELVPVTESRAPQDKRSPFGWVHRLQAHRATLRSERWRQDLKQPRGFVQFDRAQAWFAQAADGTAIRIGYVANEPRGDARFWASAIDFEMEGRDEVRVRQETQGPLEVRVYRDKDLEPRFYVVGIYGSPDDEEVTIVEVFFPDQDAYRTHQKAVRASLRTLKIR